MNATNDSLFTERDLSGYSICSALAHDFRTPPTPQQAQRPERVAHEILRNQLPQIHGQIGYGLLVPLEVLVGISDRTPIAARAHSALTSRAIQVTEAIQGGYLQGVAIGPAEARPQPLSTVLALGGTFATIREFSALCLPRVDSGTGLAWLAEFQPSPSHAIVLKTARLAPRRLAGTCAVSTELLTQTGGAAEAFVRAELLGAVAAALDRAALVGAGGVEPLGLAGTPGVQSIAFGGAPTAAKLCEAERLVGGVNGRPSGWILSNFSREKWRGVARGSSFLLSDDNRAIGYPALTTAGLDSSNRAFFGDWSRMTIAMFPAVKIFADIYSRKDEGLVEFQVETFADVGSRHPASFCVSSDSAAQ